MSDILETFKVVASGHTYIGDFYAIAREVIKEIESLRAQVKFLESHENKMKSVTVDLIDKVNPVGPYTFLRAEVNGKFARVVYAIHGVEQALGLRIDMDKKCFLDDVDDSQHSLTVHEEARRIWKTIAEEMKKSTAKNNYPTPLTELQTLSDNDWEDYALLLVQDSATWESNSYQWRMYRDVATLIQLYLDQKAALAQ